MPTSSTAATQGGRLEIASICSFSTMTVSVLSQLWLRMVRARISELPTRLQSGCVLVTSGVFFQCSSWTSSMRTNVRSAVSPSGNGWSVKGQVWPSPQKPYMNVSMYSTIGPPAAAPAGSGGAGEGRVGPLAPEAVHERVHVLDDRPAVELGGQQSVQLA